MSEKIVCPNCGELVNKDDCKTKFKLFYAYKICSNCGLKFTKLTKIIKLFVYSYLFILLALMIMAMCIIIIYNYDKLTKESTPVDFLMCTIAILGIVGIIMNILSYIISKKEIEHSYNGFLPIIEDKRQAKLISFVNEKSFSNEERNNLGHLPIIKENAIILLPCPNIVMKICLNENIRLNKLLLYNIYKIIHNDISKFVILTDYKVDEDIILYLKKFDEHEVTSKAVYDFVTLNNERICCVFMYENYLP